MGDFGQSTQSYKFLINQKIDLVELNYKPYPFLLANAFEKELQKNQ